MSAIKIKSGNTWTTVNSVVVNNNNVVQQSGTSITDVMSQSAVTKALEDIISGGGGGSITVDQVLDNTTSASTNPVSSKAVYSAVTDNELVWTNAYIALSGAVSSHTHASSAVTSMAGYTTASTVSPISTGDTLNQAIGKLESRFDGIRLLKISESDYNNLQVKDNNTLYIITD